MTDALQTAKDNIEKFGTVNATGDAFLWLAADILADIVKVNPDKLFYAAKAMSLSGGELVHGHRKDSGFIATLVCGDPNAPEFVEYVRQVVT